MPISLKPTTAPTVAETPEFQALQKQIEQATSLLASISNQIVSIEASMKPTQPAQGQQPAPIQPVQESFEESIAEMRKIAGIK
jgi:hypothetical protein